MITAKLVEYIQSTEYDQLPENVIDKTKLCFIDFLGVTLRGSKTKSGIAVKNIISQCDQSTVINQGKSNALEASLANGVFAHSLDLDDGHRYAQVHPGACVIPAALALCQLQNKSGKEFINSIVIGYQVAITLGMIVNPQHRSMGFHTTGTCGTIGAAAAACKALDLNEYQTINALGLAGTQAAGLLESDHSGSMGKHLHAGKAAQSGVLSALLAREGFTGAESILEGDEGFLKAMVDVNFKTKIKLDLNKFRILEVYFKIYPVCRHLHSSIDALLQILHETNDKFDIEKISDISVKTYKIAAEHDNYHPHTIEALKQSLPAVLAITFLNNNLKLDNLQLSQDIEKILSKIHIEHLKDFDNIYPDKRPSTVTINVQNKLYERKIDLPYGEPENPINENDIIKKFHDLNPNISIKNLVKIIKNLESYEMNKIMNSFEIL